MTAIPEHASPRDRLPYWFSAGHMCIDWPFGAIYVIAPVAGAAFGWSPAEIGLLLTIQSIGGVIAFIPAGLLMDWVSDRGRVLMMTFFWVVAGYLLASQADGFWMLALLMAFANMGDAAWHPMATGILVKAAPDRRARVLGVHAIGGAMAGVLAPLFAGYLMNFVDWRIALQAVVLPTAVMGFLFLFHIARLVPRVAPGTVARPNIRNLFRVWRTPFGLVLVAMLVLYNLGLMGATAMMPLYLRDVQGLSVFEYSLAFSGVLLVGALLQPRLGRLADEIGRRPLIQIACALSVGGAAVLVLAEPGPAAAIGALVAAVGALTAVRSVVLACAADLSEESEATTLGVAFAVLDGVGAFGALLAGWMGDGNLALAFVPTVVCSLGAGVAAFALTRMRPR
jgi:MFS family permease